MAKIHIGGINSLRFPKRKEVILYSRRKEVFKDYIRVELTNSEDAELVIEYIRSMKSNYKGRVEMKVQQARNSQIWREQSEIVKN